MKSSFGAPTRKLIWRCVSWLHHLDFAWLLPFLARLPLAWGFSLAKLRGHLNAATGRDWRSVALGFRHIRQQSLAGFRHLPVTADESQLMAWRDARFVAEARDEYEAQLLAADRVRELHCVFTPPGASIVCAGRSRGLVLLTPHYESFCLGIAFLGRTGGVVNSMSSSVTQDPRVDPAVRRHFDDKYRGLETYLNGGRVIDMESGLRPFYRMLEQHETLVVLADAPVLPGGAAMSVNFLGGRRTLAAGAVRLAQRTGSDLGGFICAPTANGRYELTLCEPGPSNDPATIDRIYGFMSAAIMANPGGWWAADLLPFMPLTEPVA